MEPIHTALQNTSPYSIQVISHRFSICKVSSYSPASLEDTYCFIGKTEEENSLVCITERMPEQVLAHDDGWRAFRIQGVLDFSLIGILAELSSLLAKNKIGIFAVSTYNTDYILVKEGNFEKALRVLSDAGYHVLSAPAESKAT